MSDSKLDKAKGMFVEWRSKRKSRSEKIPQELIDAAVLAVTEVGRGKVCAELGLSGSRLFPKQNSTPKKAKMAKNQITVTKVVSVASAPSASMEIHFPSGAVLRTFGRGEEFSQVLRTSLSQLSMGAKKC